MRAVPLHGIKARGRVAWVSDKDYERAMQYRWHVYEQQRPGGSTIGPYAVTTTPGRTDGQPFHFRMHNLIMGCLGVDHKNGYGLDNTRRNLRKATIKQNGCNQGPQVRTTASAFKGVSWHRKGRKWRAYITASGKFRHLGLFAIEADAARAYDAAAIELFGEFARLNFRSFGR